MTISLSDYEAGTKYDGDYGKDLAALEDRLERLQAAHITHGQRSVIMFEGWDAAGKGGIIKRMTALLDPRYFDVWPISAPTEEERARHFLWRFWKRWPGNSRAGWNRTVAWLRWSSPIATGGCWLIWGPAISSIRAAPGRSI